MLPSMSDTSPQRVRCLLPRRGPADRTLHDSRTRDRVAGELENSIGAGVQQVGMTVRRGTTASDRATLVLLRHGRDARPHRDPRAGGGSSFRRLSAPRIGTVAPIGPS